jgi:hypothetical protein
MCRPSTTSLLPLPCSSLQPHAGALEPLLLLGRPQPAAAAKGAPPPCARCRCARASLQQAVCDADAYPPACRCWWSTTPQRWTPSSPLPTQVGGWA